MPRIVVFGASFPLRLGATAMPTDEPKSFFLVTTKGAISRMGARRGHRVLASKPLRLPAGHADLAYYKSRPLHFSVEEIGIERPAARPAAATAETEPPRRPARGSGSGSGSGSGRSAPPIPPGTRLKALGFKPAEIKKLEDETVTFILENAIDAETFRQMARFKELGYSISEYEELSPADRENILTNSIPAEDFFSEDDGDDAEEKDDETKGGEGEGEDS